MRQRPIRALPFLETSISFLIKTAYFLFYANLDKSKFDLGKFV